MFSDLLILLSGGVLISNSETDTSRTVGAVLFAAGLTRCLDRIDNG